jgi:hypothetical protein
MAYHKRRRTVRLGRLKAKHRLFLRIDPDYSGINGSVIRLFSQTSDSCDSIHDCRASNTSLSTSVQYKAQLLTVDGEPDTRSHVGRWQGMKFTGFKPVVWIGLLFLFYAIDYSSAQEKLLLDLKRIADKPRPEIEKILGEPSKLVDDVFKSSRGYTYPALRASYMNGAIEVTYLEGGARYFKIWIPKLGGKYQDYVYPKDTSTLLGDLGLDRNITADLSNQTVTRWRYLPDLYEISVFATAEKQIWYVHVSTSRIYE